MERFPRLAPAVVWAKRGRGASRELLPSLPPSFPLSLPPGAVVEPRRQRSHRQPHTAVPGGQHPPLEAVEVRQLAQLVPHRLHHVRVPGGGKAHGEGKGGKSNECSTFQGTAVTVEVGVRVLGAEDTPKKQLSAPDPQARGLLP